MRRGATPPNHELTNRWSWRSIIANLTRSACVCSTLLHQTQDRPKYLYLSDSDDLALP
ncbi:hypothetical protein NHJ13734_005701 [Beauveria thailandica]